MARRIRVQGASVLASLAVAALVFPFFAGLTYYVMAQVVNSFADRLFPPRWSPPDWVGMILVGVVLGLPLLLAYLGSRWVYSIMRWKDVVIGGRYCVQCGYDLTGNVSGRCPECGLDLTDGETAPNGATGEVEADG
ncbi:MAG: hypothetical protein PVJ57_20695 [Phycisphaerae bacterium]|jgi:hypothetical protein